MKVLFIIERYLSNAGASSAMRQYIFNNPELEEPVAFCGSCNKKDGDTLLVQEAGADAVLDYYLAHGYRCIHYFRSDRWNLFEALMQAATRRGIRLPVITTVCQKPSYLPCMLRPYEIECSDYLVFIDKAAYGDDLYAFIPEERKMLNYLGSTKARSQQIIDLADANIPDNRIPVIGRASTLNKCPDDMFEVFDRLDNPKKILIIGGEGGELQAKIQEQAAQRREQYEVEITGYLPRTEYLKRLTEIDIYLYHLRPDAYSSLDATLGTAMRMKKPCVYMGPPAPEERFEQGVNGFVAKSNDELVRYTNMLLHDAALREQLGSNARESTLRDFGAEKTIQNFNILYHKLVNGEALPPLCVPLSFRLYFLYRFMPQHLFGCCKDTVRRFLRKVKRMLLPPADGTAA